MSFEHLSNFVDRVNKTYDRKQFTLMRERIKYKDDDDEDFDQSPSQKTFMFMEERKEKGLILSHNRRVINHILLYLMDFSIYDDNEVEVKKKKKKKKASEKKISEELLSLILVNKQWYELVSAHHQLYELMKEGVENSFYGKNPLCSTSSLLLKIPCKFHSISGVNQTKIVLQVDTQIPLFISCFKIYYEIFKYIYEDCKNHSINQRMDTELREVFENSTDRIKMIMSLNYHHDFQFFLRDLKNHFLEKGFCVIFCHGGSFSGCVFQKNGRKQKNAEPMVATVHKTFHKYVTRKKQGKRQVSKDQSKRAKSVGSQIRRMQEEHFKLKTRKYLTMWSDSLSKRDTIIFLNAPGPYNEYTLFNKKKEAGTVQIRSPLMNSNRNDEDDDESRAVKNKENKYEEFIDKKYICPFSQSQCFTMPSVKTINSSNPNHNSCIEANDELLSIYLHDLEGLKSLQNNTTPEQIPTNFDEDDEDEVYSNDEEDEDYDE